MKYKKMRNLVIVLMFSFVVAIGIIFSYNGYVNAKNACDQTDGVISEESAGFLYMNWSISCEK